MGGRHYNFEADLALSSYPPEIRGPFSYEGQLLLKELEKNQLKVVLVRAPRPKYIGHKIRLAIEHNPKWYSQLYIEHPHFRRDRSLKALERIASQKDRPFREDGKSAVHYKYHYDSIYRQLIFERLTAGYTDEIGREIPLQPAVSNYFCSLLSLEQRIS